MSSQLATRLGRLLNLVPYFIANPGIRTEDAAKELGVSVAELTKDLNQLWLCGLPGYGPGDLIDLSFSEDTVQVTFSAGIDRPLRLTSTEATALLVALRALLELPGTADPAATRSAIAKIESAAGVAALSSVPAPVESPDPRADGADDCAAAVRSALRHQHALEIRYFSASRDVITDRVVDPLRVVLVEDHSYLEAWCRLAEGVRLFRFDRIDAARELDEPANPPGHAVDSDAGSGLFQASPALPVARLLVQPAAVWVLDYYPMDQLAQHPDGAIEASMQFADPEWMARLLVGFGGGVRVLEPASLADLVAERASAALAAYGESA